MVTFVTVPVAPGVPAVARDPNSIPTLPDVVTSDQTIGYGAKLKPQWGIYSNSSLSPVLVADTVAAFDLKGEEVIADFPIEGGQFESYDKVRRPYEARIQFVVGTSGYTPVGIGAAFQRRQSLLLQVESVLHDAGARGSGGQLPTYTIVTPEVIYANASLTRYDYQRHTSSGVTLLKINVFAQEVLIQGNTALSVGVAGQPPTYSGPVVATPASPQQTAIVNTPGI